jgi:hypothetical protein
VARIASGRAARATSYAISGSGLAIAKMIGRAAMPRIISALTTPPTDRPTNASAPRSASAIPSYFREVASASLAGNRSVR